MSNRDDSDAINGLFDRVEDVARNAAPRDRDAEVLIQQRLRDYPPAPYYMAQTILVQEVALRQARERIEQLESAQSQQRGGFLGGLFGGDEPQRQPQRARGPWDRGAGGNGGFLAGAAQTALGVTGGMLLGSAIAGMFTGGANAQELEPSPAEDTDAGSDDYDGGDFDIGGDF
ncbi:hypothetical protein WH87_07820 [Devosia epidermidihirudinis]|uniref:ABC transporter substrate-binding protein n=1 Tax=Devosia epidermidihirudinis TaxID=1293439 RepID=A0A0F5QDJ5_9HYPH|nr:DUF2076 domain-containing protein [Devosia epidermidihirudinis]KKC38801.1 hypothetical protein WH87_07820 [Devosia epidermidihirudinis]